MSWFLLPVLAPIIILGFVYFIIRSMLEDLEDGDY